jgi:hypothetical protein
MRRFIFGACSTFAALALVAGAAPGCGSDSNEGSSSGSSGDSGPQCVGFGCSNEGGKIGCIGLECKQVTCDPGVTTTLSGTVLDPAGKVPIYNAIVYVPNAAVAPITPGVTGCDRCDAQVSGSPVVITQTDVEGKFKLENVPVAPNLPVVIQIGKWRRQIKVATVNQCANTDLSAGETRLPKNRTEGDIPKIALATGAADPLQCLLRKMGLDDAEFGAPGSESRVHLYAGGGYDSGGAKLAQNKFAASVSGGADFGNAETLWGSVAELKKYDLVLLSCEGTENDTTQHKPEAAKTAVYTYASEGGRVFASHYHHTFFSAANAPAAPADTQKVASWAIPEKQPPAQGNPATTAVNSDIVGTFPKAVAMKDWLEKQGALSGGKLPIFDARHNVNAVNVDGLNWIEAVNPNEGGSKAVQYMTFNTPVGAAEDKVCGRVVFSNLHVGAGEQSGVSDDPTSAAAFPDGCKTVDLSAQQKALEFMLFDLSSCVQKDDAPVLPK